MDLWIRSQNRERLLKVNNKVSINEAGIFFVDDKQIANYKTKKRALEVLDEIQLCLNRRTIISPRRITDYERIKKEFFDSDFIITDGSVDIVPCDVIVYEMPER